MAKKPRWLDEPEEKDYAAARSCLSLLLAPDEVSEALGYLGFRSCLEARGTPGSGDERTISIFAVDTGCLQHYVGD